ncbi:MAG: deoxyribose-phosphate aldolase [Saprospiraceae bacterium]|nr:deoxyribose-phosphate aldolase [Saprospiraceae bacterium]
MSTTIAKMIDHAVLHPTQMETDLDTAISLSLKYNIASLCVKPYMVKHTSAGLAGSEVLCSTVIGFPHGSNASTTKLFESEKALYHGARELDMVANIGRIKSGDWINIRNEVDSIGQLCHDNQAIVKVIIETDFLTSDEIIAMAQLLDDSAADFIKTSTGFGYTKRSNGFYAYDGALLDNVVLIKNNIKGALKIKASGGIRDLETLKKFKSAGAERIGTSSTESIMEEALAG